MVLNMDNYLRDKKKIDKKSKSILIVEDQLLVAKDLQQKLISVGYNVAAVCSSGEEALSLMKTYNPDIVLMDIVLDGEMDGIETAEKIRIQFEKPVIYITAYHDSEIINRVKVTEPFGYIVKPINDQQLLTAIELGLYKHKVERQRDILLDELQLILSQSKLLDTNLPICTTCKNVRNDEGNWENIEEYFTKHLNINFTSGVCPHCLEKMYPNAFRVMKEQVKQKNI